VTDFWEHFSVEKEIDQARNMAAAAKDAGVEHVIWSTLEDTRRLVPLGDPRMPTLQGKYKVPHFDGKGEADAVFREVGVPTTFLLAAFYWENFIYFGSGPQRGEDGKLVLTLPLGERPLSGIAAADIGKCAYGILKDGKRLLGQRIGIAGEHLTGTELAAALSKGMGESVRYQPLTWDAFRALGFPGADDLGNMFQVYRDFETEVVGARNLDVARSLNPSLLTFDQWLAKNRSKISLE
jgi:uncharacterized protein YbjT (DUF2867 family)